MVTAATSSKLPALTVEQAEHWIAAALAEAAALRQYDHQLFPSRDDAAEMQIAEELHASWGQWVQQAEALYDRITPLMKQKRHIAGAHDLNYAIGRAGAMLKISPKQMLARMEQARRGETFSAEEVRRALHLAPRR